MRFVTSDIVTTDILRNVHGFCSACHLIRKLYSDSDKPIYNLIFGDLTLQRSDASEATPLLQLYHHDLLRHKAANKIQWNTTKAQV